MADTTPTPDISAEAVEKAARAYYAAVRTRVRMPDFDDLPPSTQQLAMAEARAALAAAVPIVLAARDEEIRHLARLHDERDRIERDHRCVARDNETAGLRDAVAEIAELRANWVDDYVKRALKRWRESAWTSAEADRIEQEAIQKWNARHPALIALWRRHEQARAASPRGGQ